MVRLTPAGTIEQQIGVRPSIAQVQSRRDLIQQQKGERVALQSSVDKIISDINSGKITSFNQIPSNLRQYINVPSDYFTKRVEYSKQLVTYNRQLAEYNLQVKEAEEWKSAEKWFRKGMYDPYASPSWKKKYRELSVGGMQTWSEIIQARKEPVFSYTLETIPAQQLVGIGGKPVYGDVGGKLITPRIIKPPVTTYTFETIPAQQLVGIGGKPVYGDIGGRLVSSTGIVAPTESKFISQYKYLKFPFTIAKKEIEEKQAIVWKATEYDIPGVKKFKKGLEKKGTAGQVASIFIPQTYGDLIVKGAIIAAYPALPVVAQIGVSTTFGVYGLKTAFDPTKPVPERIAGGIVGVAGIAGVTYEATPFIKGQLGKFYPTYKPVKIQPEGFKAIGKGTGKIGIIPTKAPLKIAISKVVKLPKTSPLKRGAFGVRPGEKVLFLGKDQKVATSQIGFFRKGKDITLGRKIYVTPQDPSLKIAVTRVSRLGLKDPFKLTPKAKISWGWPKTPQIGVEKGVSVTRIGKGVSWKIGTGTELEATKGIGTIVSAVKKTGVTTIKGQRVDLFTFITTKGKAALPKGKAIITEFPSSTSSMVTTSGWGFISTFLGFPVRRVSATPSKTIISTTITPSIISFPSPPPTSPISITSTPTILRTIPTTPTIPRTTTTTPPTTLPPTLISPPITIPTTPPTTSPTTLITPPITSPIITPRGIFLPSTKAPPKEKKEQGYIPQALSKGKWKNLSKKPMNRTAALGRASRAVDKTVSAQFRIKKVRGKVSAKRDAYFGRTKHKYRPYRIRKGLPIRMHNRFIEKRAFRIDTPGEKRGLSIAKFSKQMNWLGTPIKKRKKKKTKRKSLWLV